ncbi:MAG: RnfABCDGE type electron transport complex subunit G [Candidatus Aegiribacteria sp.]|nr:RnfABCDGE type electron transport complex subunit G [Candidatus Aegiribacteria sp.]MBD3294460.1 RnfABCDGE type electron transport complex subunit G [Candidatus Fermentibacteria bacterium]
MAEMFKLGVVLMLVALAAAVALGLVNSRTAPIIAQQKEMEKQNAMSEVAVSLGTADSLAFDSLDVQGLSNPYASTGNSLSIVRVSVPPDTTAIGYLFIAYGKGYSSTIQTMVAADMQGRVAGSTILYQQETPGLGANVVTPSKLIDKFTGLTASQCLLTKDGGSVDAMTGCTITSRAVTNSVRDGLEAMEEAGVFTTGAAPSNEEDPPQDECVVPEEPGETQAVEGGTE